MSAHPLREPLQAGVRALGLLADDGQLRQLLAYLDLLAQWNKVYNLTAVRNPQDMLTHHLLDSLSVIASLRRHTQGRAASLSRPSKARRKPRTRIEGC